MQKSKEKRTKGPLGSFLGYLVSTVISVVVVIYLGYHFVSSLGNELVTEHALQVTENNIMEFDAYILKNETVVYSETGGEVGYEVSDGTKVRMGSPIASIYSGASSDGSVRSEIISLDRVIELLTESNDISGLAASDTSTIDNRIDSFYDTIRENTEQGVYANLPKRRDELLTLLNKRQVITGKVKNFDGIIEDLQNEREALTSTLDAVSETVSAPATGFFYSGLDGYESLFNTASVSSMTPDLFDRMLTSEPTSYPPTAIGKIATDFNWYIIVETTRDELRYYVEDKSYRIIFPYNNDTELSMKLYDIVAIDGNQRILLIFSTSEAPEDFSYKRMQPVKVIKSSYTGYKVPVSAARLLDGEMGVYILVGSTVDFRYIDVIEEFDGFYIVAPRDIENDPLYYTKLGLYDNIIVSGKDLFVGKLIS